METGSHGVTKINAEVNLTGATPKTQQSMLGLPTLSLDPVKDPLKGIGTTPPSWKKSWTGHVKSTAVEKSQPLILAAIVG
jgi:hypothetical protein